MDSCQIGKLEGQYNPPKSSNYRDSLNIEKEFSYIMVLRGENVQNETTESIDGEKGENYLNIVLDDTITGARGFIVKTVDIPSRIEDLNSKRNLWPENKTSKFE